MNDRFPDWNTIYDEQEADTMGWYYPELDPDLKEILIERNLISGMFLDLGTGPGTQAEGLAKIGFSVTATDISREAIELAAKKYSDVEFLQDDVLNSALNRKFDFIFDRGCFHVFDEKQRQAYLLNIVNLLKEGGLLFLKCFSDKEPEVGKGPYRFSKKMINNFFVKDFFIESVKDTIYQGTRLPAAKALFIIMKRT